jgi:hypothetical protein
MVQCVIKKRESSSSLTASVGASQIQGRMRAQGSRSDPCQKCSRITLGLLNLGKCPVALPWASSHCSVGFFAVGCFFIAAGAIVKTNYQNDIFNLNTTRINPKDAQDLRDLATLAPIVLIVAGCIVMLLSLSGCIGSCFEKRYLLIVYPSPSLALSLQNLQPPPTPIYSRPPLQSTAAPHSTAAPY